MIIAIFAVDEMGGMGLQGSMPWPFNKDDMKWFKSNTINQVVVMGRKTWDSTGMPKPLPNRTNIVFTKNSIENVYTVHGNVTEELVQIQQKFLDKNVFVIGGADLLRQAEPAVEKIYLSKIPGNYNCDVILDVFQFTKNFKLVNKTTLNLCNIEEYERISPSFT